MNYLQFVDADTVVLHWTCVCVCVSVHCTAGLNVLFSGAADEFAFAANAYDILIPAFHSALLTRQPPVSFSGSDPSVKVLWPEVVPMYAEA